MIVFLKKHGAEILFAVIIFVCLIFLFNIVVLLRQYSVGVDNQAKDNAELYTFKQRLLVDYCVDDTLGTADVAAGFFADCESDEDIFAAIDRVNAYLSGNKYFKQLRYIADGEEYYRYNIAVERNIISDSEAGLTQPIRLDNQTCFAFIASVPTGRVSKIGLIFNKSIVTDSFSDLYKTIEDKFVYPEFAVLCTLDGRILQSVDDGEKFPIGATFSDTYGTILGDSDYRKTQALFLKEGSEIVTYGSNKYVVTALKSNGLVISAFYNVNKIYGEGYELIGSIWATMIAFFLMMITVAVSFILNRRKIAKRIYEIGAINPILNCPTLLKFERDTQEILERNKATQFAIIVAKINNFNFIMEKFGEYASSDLLKYARNMYKHALVIDETYAYIADGEYALLMHYKDKQALIDRLNSVYLSIGNYSGFDDYKIKITYSIYEVEQNVAQSVPRMIDKAMVVKDSSKENKSLVTYNFYSDVLRSDFLKKAEIEGKMESSLKNREFWVFYQPKYNIVKKRMDGCELLIRWFDSSIGDYRCPDEFMPLFEVNGFVVKIDRFVFYRACEDISQAIEKGQKVYPVSVNVSRVTATQGDFVDYYAKIKKKFAVPDKFITLEFTESFAYENNEYLAYTVKRLRQNGFNCSLDDFGTGYSSYNTLKALEIDEIKLDKFFLTDGISRQRDYMLLKSVIQLVKDMGMKVTQEGVETQADYYKLKKLGCEVIQGYYYARPMKYTEYCKFLENDDFDPETGRGIVEKA